MPAPRIHCASGILDSICVCFSQRQSCEAERLKLEKDDLAHRLDNAADSIAADAAAADAARSHSDAAEVISLQARLKVKDEARTPPCLLGRRGLRGLRTFSPDYQYWYLSQVL